MAGAFIAVEGVDGSGKSGVVRALVAGLQARGLDVLGTREPGGTPQGEALRGLLLAGADEAWEPRAELLLMTAARVQHIARVVLPAVAAGRIVVSDRYAGSTLAYQGAGRGMDAGLIRDLHAAMVDDVWPDLTLVLDIDPAVGLARSRKRLADGGIDEGRFESLALPFHQRIRASFLAQAVAAPERHAVIDASGTPEAVRAAALAAVEAALKI
ncbi:dTMP kinase [Sphingomonas sp. RP10(2022)]|uniref:Thymidylate kinase n=1 Tax=Sphingomonas liriopis TaxID=2949094 RepID=A0A9X2KTB7_9SPHN|nr:dTMP kinase [Sphingomonas liriopis]MCP3734728.1 dTMP kinase [Sphingomonas liriopis]